MTANDTARGKGGGRADKAPGTAWQGGPNSAASLSQPAATAAADWPGVDFRALAAGAFPPINGSPIDRARRLVALGLGAEALAVLGQADPLDRAYPFLKGAAACLADRPDAVLVFDRALDAEPEIGFWRTVAALRLSRAVDPAALRAAIGTLLAYPKEIARRFVPLILDAMLAKRSLSDAARLAELIPLKWPELAGEPAIQLLQGRVHLAAGDTDKARNIFEVVARSADFASAVAARKYLVDADVAAGRLNLAAALILLDRQRPLWRGQDFEESFMDDLASIADQAGLVDRQLAVLSEIASSAANAEDHDRALAAVRAALLAAVDRHDLGAKLRVMAYVRMQPQLAEGAGDGLRVRAIAKDQAETMGLPLQALAGNFSKFESPSNPAAAASTADDRKIVIEPPPRKPAVLNVAAMVDSAALPPIGKVAGEPDAIAAALDREIAAAHAVLAAARETPSSSSPLAP
ncbi:hypothetical protein [Arboricoccus pini]|uniref:hypothetical protein n=1 Tax=Arboricoccus pini TaxID=1963835 RepID=UPI001054F153|nr:hypothetical protein [Arboricoccus pini]